MKKLLVLGAGLLQVPVIKKAKEMGVMVLAADDDASAPGLSLCNKPLVGYGIFNKEAMLEVAQHEGIDGVIHPCSEVAMNTMGFINDRMHLHGVGLETAIRATNKGMMRKAFEIGGAPSPRSFEVRTLDEVQEMSKQLDGDIIVKPSRNSGSRGVTKLTEGYDVAALNLAFDRAWEESRDKSVVIEQFIDGPEFSVEIIIYKGMVSVLQVTDKKTTGAPYFVELGHNQPSLFPQEDVERIKDAAVKGVKALELDNCAAHAEIKLQNDRAYIMEIGARLGGDFIGTELTHLSTGIDMMAAAISVALGEEPDLTPKTAPQGVCIRYWHPSPGILTTIENIEYLQKDYVYQYELYNLLGDTINEVKSSLDRSGHLIVISPTVQDAIERADAVIEKVKFITK